MDDRSKRGKADRIRINVNEPHELRYWCKKLAVNEGRLREVVHTVGVMVKDVEAYLAN
jgi:hypothetical protein